MLSFAVNTYLPLGMLHESRQHLIIVNLEQITSYRPINQLLKLTDKLKSYKSLRLIIEAQGLIKETAILNKYTKLLTT